MQIAYIAVAAVLSVMLVLSARMKLVRDQRAVDVIGGVVGVPLAAFPLLALLEIAGAVGLLAGIWLEPLGVAAAAGLVAYFIAALASHLRVRDLNAEHLFPGTLLLLMSAAALVLAIIGL
jgi:DoxX-like family